jgi:hypothetical protein
MISNLTFVILVSLPAGIKYCIKSLSNSVESIDLLDLAYWYPVVHQSSNIVCFSLYCFKPRWNDFDHFPTISNATTYFKSW